jgi:hypothetical protein
VKLTAHARITCVWIGLSALTVLSWGLGSAREGNHLVASTPITIGVLAAAAVKVRFIIQEFMEVRTAPAWVRRFTDVWLAVFWVTILVIYRY